MFFNTPTPPLHPLQAGLDFPEFGLPDFDAQHPCESVAVCRAASSPPGLHGQAPSGPPPRPRGKGRGDVPAPLPTLQGSTVPRCSLPPPPP